MNDRTEINIAVDFNPVPQDGSLLKGYEVKNLVGAPTRGNGVSVYRILHRLSGNAGGRRGFGQCQQRTDQPEAPINTPAPHHNGLATVLFWAGEVLGVLSLAVILFVSLFFAGVSQ